MLKVKYSKGTPPITIVVGHEEKKKKIPGSMNPFIDCTWTTYHHESTLYVYAEAFMDPGILFFRKCCRTSSSMLFGFVVAYCYIRTFSFSPYLKKRPKN